MESRRFESLFQHLFSTCALDSSANTRSPAVVAAWALLQCVHRLTSAMCFDTLLALAPASFWGLVAQAVDIAKPTVLSVMGVLTQAERGSVAGTSSVSIAEVERRLMGSIVKTAGSTLEGANQPSTKLFSTTACDTHLHDEFMHQYLFVWLAIVALPLSTTHLDNTTSTKHNSTEKDTTSIGNKRSLHQDAESFDFFADNDSAEEDSNLRHNGRKRLRKKNESVARSQSSDVHPFVPSLSSGNNSGEDKKKVFVLFEQQRQFLVDHALQGCGVGVLIHQLSNTDYGSSTATSNSSTKYSVHGLCIAIETILALLEHSTAVDADCWTLTLETSVSHLLGTFY